MSAFESRDMLMIPGIFVAEKDCMNEINKLC